MMKGSRNAIRGAIAPPERSRSIADVRLRNTIFLRLFLATVPLHLSPAFNDGLMDIPWLRVSAMMVGLMFAEFLISFRPKKRLDPTERTALLAFVAYLAIFTITFARSIPNLHIIAAAAPLSFSTKASTYIDSLYVLNVLSILPFVYVIMNANTLEELLELVRAIAVAMTIQSCVVIVSILQDPSVLTSFDRAGVSKVTEAVLGLHYNDAATSYILTGPLLLYMAIRRGGFWTVAYGLAVMAILLLESRTGLEVFFLTSLITLVVMRQTDVLILVVPLIAAGVFLLFGDVLLSYISIGFTGSQGFSVNDALTGRTDSIWLPLLKEWWGKPHLFWFGGGQYSLLTSYSHATGAIYEVAQAHNAYLEFFLDTGIIVFTGFVAAIAYFTWKAFRWARAHNNQLFWVLLLGWIGFLIAGLTGRRFFPATDDWLVFPLLAMAVNIQRLTDYAGNRQRVLRRSPAQPVAAHPVGMQ